MNDFFLIFVVNNRTMKQINSKIPANTFIQIITEIYNKLSNHEKNCGNKVPNIKTYEFVFQAKKIVVEAEHAHAGQDTHFTKI